MTPSWEINAALPFYTADFVQPGMLDVLLNEGEPFEAAASDNDVYEWVPEVPLRMYYCTEDEQVFYQNALVAEAYMTDNGAESVEAIDLGAFEPCRVCRSGHFWFNAVVQYLGNRLHL